MYIEVLEYSQCITRKILVVRCVVFNYYFSKFLFKGEEKIFYKYKRHWRDYDTNEKVDLLEDQLNCIFSKKEANKKVSTKKFKKIYNKILDKA